MSTAELTVHADAAFISPWVLHVLVALEEKRLPYHVETAPLPLPAEIRERFQARAAMGKVPLLVHGDAWLSESTAISEYLAERFPFPDHPRLFPADLVERARARQVMAVMRTSLFALREERPTSLVFPASRPAPAKLSERGAADATELVRYASAVIAPGAATIAREWCIADVDLAMALMRLVANGDPVPERLAGYAHAQWARPSVKSFLQRHRDAAARG